MHVIIADDVKPHFQEGDTFISQSELSSKEGIETIGCLFLIYVLITYVDLF